MQDVKTWIPPPTLRQPAGEALTNASVYLEETLLADAAIEEAEQ
jgi:hypothetical protein